MDSGTKLKLSDQDISSIILKSMGNQVLGFEELVDGMANAAYRIDLVNGEKVVLKIGPPHGFGMMRYESNIMSTEVALLQKFADILPVPKVLHYDESQSFLPSPFFIMRFLPGTPYNKIKSSLSEEDQARIEYQLGSYNRIINDVKGEHFGYFSLKESWRNNWEDAFLFMMESLLRDGRDANVELPINAADLEKELLKQSFLLRDITEPSLLHWDLWDGNFFVHEGKITGIIDFERALWGDPIMEYYFSHLPNSAAFRKGYGLMELSDRQLKRRAMYDLYLDLIMVIECTYREFSDLNQLKWASNHLKENWKKARAVWAE